MMKFASRKCVTIPCTLISKRVLSIHHQIAGRKRFYKLVDVVPKPNEPHITHISSPSIQYAVTLDGKYLKTPARNPLLFTNEYLAMAIASEWDLQTNARLGIQPQTMPFMSLASTAIDNLVYDPLPAQSTCLSFLPTDSLLFWTSEDQELFDKQEKEFQPIINWMEETFHINLLQSDLMTSRLEHSPTTTQTMKQIINNMDPFSLACLQSATMECKSIILAFAFLLGRIDIDQAKMLSRMEEEHQLTMWGLVEGGHDMDRLNNTCSLGAAGTFWNLYHELKSQDEILQLLLHGVIGVTAKSSSGSGVDIWKSSDDDSNDIISKSGEKKKNSDMNFVD